ncbi:hypothetical protein HPB50_012654 [Hyalomma asiaticum]|uniref:Uncharacterized protein n=1 Tax=Hyalomma asiaticum TaxID=266040 RepID=A0ACB7SXZ2_HYAAI|nr:hypothetical protein HPB50_012654 [Hyalomma asiaticum]
MIGKKKGKVQGTRSFLGEKGLGEGLHEATVGVWESTTAVALYPLGKEDEPHGAAALIPVAIPIIPSRKSVIRARPAEPRLHPPQLPLPFSSPATSEACGSAFAVRSSASREGVETPLFAPLGPIFTLKPRCPVSLRGGRLASDRKTGTDGLQVKKSRAKPPPYNKTLQDSCARIGH